MPFIKNTQMLIRESNKNISKITFDNGIILISIDEDFKIKNSKKIIEGKYSFVDAWFDIDEEDNIYGLINDKQGNLAEVNIAGDEVKNSNFIEYNYNEEVIKFPYIKKLEKNTHIIYYIKRRGSLFSLIHYLKRDDKYIKIEIDKLNSKLLNNFVVISNKNRLSILYFKVINRSEELFISTFEEDILTWSKPYQITNSGKEKIYLSAIKDSNDCYHIVFSQKQFNKFYCTYINGYLEEEKFNISEAKYVSDSVVCNLPHIIDYNDKLYSQWIEYNDLYISYSEDRGKTWSDPKVDEVGAEHPFIRYNYKSNYKLDEEYSLPTIYGCRDYINILGF